MVCHKSLVTAEAAVYYMYTRPCSLQIVNLSSPFLFLRTLLRRVMQCSEPVQAVSLVLFRRRCME